MDAGRGRWDRRRGVPHRAKPGAACKRKAMGWNNRPKTPSSGALPAATRGLRRLGRAAIGTAGRRDMEPTTNRFFAYAQAFEQTFADDDWSRLAQYFEPDAVYEVRNVPFACRIEGRDAIFRGIKKSLDNFDRRFADRRLE